MDNLMMLGCFNADGMLKEIYSFKDGPMIVGAWGKDMGTMERKLKLALVYPDGEVSPIHEYQQSKLTSARALKELADLDGLDLERVEDVYEAIMKKKHTLAVQADSNGKCSLQQAYRELCDYVERYEEPGRVFIKDGYGNILAKDLNRYLEKLELGYNRMELQKNFKAWGLLRVSDKAGHEYSYRINDTFAKDWYFSFKLPEESVAA